MTNAVLYASLGERLTRYDLDVEGATLTRRESVLLPQNVQYAWPHPSKKYLYVASSSRGPRGNFGVGHHLTGFRVDSSTGALTRHGEPQALTHRPIHMSLDRAGRYALVAYSDPSGASVHRLNDDGTIGALVQQPSNLDAGIYAHQILPTPSNRTVVLVTRGHDANAGKAEEPGALKLFSFNDGVLANRGAIAPNGGCGFGPRHLDFHPTKPWMYVSLERQNHLQLFTLGPNDEMPERAVFSKNYLVEPDNVRGRQLGGTVHVHPNGRFVYVANRNDTTVNEQGREVFGGGENGIAVFAIDQATGEPTLIQHVDPRSMHVRTFALDPGGRVMVTASIRDVPVRDGAGVKTVPNALSVLRVGADGKLDFVRKYDVETGGKLQWWMGIVSL